VSHAVRARRLARRGGAYFFAVLALPVASMARAQADDRAYELSPVEVRARFTGNLPTDGHSTSVIEAEDIERSAATSLPELIAREANVNLQSLSGTEKWTSLDIRGMGETASSNVVVLVDGVRLNELDLSGSDLSGLNLSRIERIRIVRGGGAVRVGDGAVGGVIDIVTRAPAPGTVSGSLRAEAGAYGTRKYTGSVAAGAGPLSLQLTAGRSDTDGFRRNGYLYSRDGSAELRFSPDARFSAWVRVVRHVDEYGLPGGLPASVLSQGEAARRAAASLLNGGTTDDSRYMAGADIDAGPFGVTRVQASSRLRENPFIIGCVSAGCDEAPIRSSRHALQIDHEIDLPSALGARPHQLGFGLNSWNGDYQRHTGSPTAIGTTRHSGDIHSHGGYADARLALGERWTLNLGARIDRFRSDRDTEVLSLPTVVIPVPPFVAPCTTCAPFWAASAAPSRGTWRNHAREIGLSWDATPTLSIHASASSHFRSPNIDELAQASADIRPQSGRTEEAGMRYRPVAGAELALSVFRIRIDDEIFFGRDAFGVSNNTNFPLPTERRGFEFQSRWPLTSVLRAAFNFGYVQPKADDFDGDLPGVPRRNASLRLDWQVLERVDATLAARYVSSVRDNNAFDDPNPRPRLAAYTVVDAGMRWRPHGEALSMSLSVNNLFDRAYATRQYSGDVYPMPGRHVMVAASMTF